MCFNTSGSKWIDLSPAEGVWQVINFPIHALFVYFRGKYDFVADMALPLFFLVSWLTGLITDALVKKKTMFLLSEGLGISW